MSYTPTIWSNGSKITAAKLNKLENAIDGGANSQPLILTPTTILTTTYSEIEEAYLSGTNVIYYDNTEGETYNLLQALYKDDMECYCNFSNYGFTASSPTNYLVEHIQEDIK